ncbi:threonine/serine ThrE exporter family protein [Parashewanella tropica]|uniref:threonine/serine ThrE exporter family protein n=1 Tax=Parashewanella tropica TaxID=2547970 RepID=UPI001059F225|nr:threonine/serine exporter family protein [Parashewanella tropica]
MNSKSHQTHITRLIARTAQLSLAYGADSDLVEDISQRLGKALGLNSIELSISSNALVITSLVNNSCVTTTRRIRAHGLNMTIVYELQRICIKAEKGIYDANKVERHLNRLKVKSYPAYLLIPAIGLSCACFCHLFGGDLAASMITFLASACGMALRLLMAKRHFNLLVNFHFTALLITVVAQLAYLPNISTTPELASAASVLLLVPGFPLINAMSDMIKGHMNVGIARWGQATLLTVSSVIGITIALQISKLIGLH